jgi:hypothetical protein
MLRRADPSNGGGFPMSTRQKPSHARLRDHLPLAPRREQYFRWRGTEVSRVEGFTDAVFAFAVTLLVVALEVPRTFEGLMDVVRGFPAFVLCFALLMAFWNSHYRFHRRYGLESAFTRLMTLAILVLVLFFVYPLKYLFTLMTAQFFGLELHEMPRVEGLREIRTLYLIYGLGLAGVWGLYAVMYGHALAGRRHLELDTTEVILTRASVWQNLIYVGVCLLSITLALLTNNTWMPGAVYLLLGPLQAFNGWWFGRQVRALAATRV